MLPRFGAISVDRYLVSLFCIVCRVCMALECACRPALTESNQALKKHNQESTVFPTSNTSSGVKEQVQGPKAKTRSFKLDSFSFVESSAFCLLFFL